MTLPTSSPRRVAPEGNSTEKSMEHGKVEQGSSFFEIVLKTGNRLILREIFAMAGASTPTTSDEDADLSRLGLQSLAKRDIGPLAIVGLGWNICNSWSAIAATLVISISSGGPVTLLYGIVLIFVLGGACALSMAEIASVYPTAGGQYHWTSILTPRRYSRGLVRLSVAQFPSVADVCIFLELLLRQYQLPRLDCQWSGLHHSNAGHHSFARIVPRSDVYPRNMAYLSSLPSIQYRVYSVQHFPDEKDSLGPRYWL